MSVNLSLQEFVAAKARLEGIAHLTPLVSSTGLSEATGIPLFFKCENLQRTGSFKIRGAYNKMSQLSDIERRAGVVSASSGNSGCGIAYAGKLLGIRTIIVMPENVAPAKRAACLAYGAEVLFAGLKTSERLQRASELSQELGMTIVHPYDDLKVIAGQGTIGLEILQQLPDVEQVIVQIGGGGLLAGIATALRESGFTGRIVGIEPEASPRMAYAWQKGHPELLPDWAPSVADGINSIQAGDLTYPLIRRHVDQLVEVSEAEILEATKLLVERCKLFVEPSGAATLAAALAGKLQTGLKTVCILSGGNTDILTLAGLMQRAIQ